jgi:acetyl-CoA carboxylase biotin carboxyl carrier protein
VLTFEQIKELIDLVATHRLTAIELERSGFRIRIDGYKAARPAAAPAPPAAPTAAATAAPEPAAAAEPKSVEAGPPAADAHVVHSPIVGTFYRSPNPEAPPFAEVGSRVKQGQILCIVEAMKLMNEIESDIDGIVVEIYPKNAQPVEYGEPLFAIKTD